MGELIQAQGVLESTTSMRCSVLAWSWLGRNLGAPVGLLVHFQDEPGSAKIGVELSREVGEKWLEQHDPDDRYNLRHEGGQIYIEPA